MPPSLDIIIINWNAGQRLRTCLESIVTADRDGFHLNRVVVVDNASTDGSVDGLENIDLPLTTIRNTQNRGFGAAANQGAGDSRTDYLLFLNPDARLYPNSLSRPMAFMEQPEHQHIGIAGVQLIGDSGRVEYTCSRFPQSRHFFTKILGLNYLFPRRFSIGFMTDWDHAESRAVDHVMGACYLVRRALFEHLGGFDERFFMYFEDLDFSLRAYQAGWRSFYLADVQVYHRGGGVSEQVKATRLFYSLRSRILYGYKHFSWWAATGLMLGTMLLEPITRIIFALSKGSLAEVQQTLRGSVMLWVTLPWWITRKH